MVRGIGENLAYNSEIWQDSSYRCNLATIKLWHSTSPAASAVIPPAYAYSVSISLNRSADINELINTGVEKGGQGAVPGTPGQLCGLRALLNFFR